MMKKLAILSLVLCLVAMDALAQKPKKTKVHEIGPSLGISSFFGDLGGADQAGRAFFFDFDVDATKPAFGILYKYNINKFFTIRAATYLAYIAGDDKLTEFEARRQRNLHFQSQLIEGSINLEINLSRFEVGTDDRFAPYLFFGVGFMSFNPQAFDSATNEWVDLQPLGTEGQNLTSYPERDPYALTQLVIPYGGGFKFGITPSWALALEFAPRLTFTDYMDDVSKTYVNHSSFESRRFADRSGDDVMYIEGNQRGDPSNNDSYFFGGLLSLTYKIGSKKKKMDCPKFNLGQ